MAVTPKSYHLGMSDENLIHFCQNLSFGSIIYRGEYCKLYHIQNHNHKNDDNRFTSKLKKIF